MIAGRGTGKPGGSAAKRLAVSEGYPYLVPIGDSIVLATKTEAFKIIYDRLKYLRRWEGVRRRKEG